MPMWDRPRGAEVASHPWGRRASPAGMVRPVSNSATSTAQTSVAEASSAQAALVAASTGQPRRVRDPFFDNAKFLAIVLVVAGHAIESLLDVPAARAGYVFLYMFHMPVFIIIAGYFSQGFPSSSDKVRKLITQLLVPFAVFQLAYMALARLVGGRDVDITLLDPYFLVWFLLALFAWRLSTPVWQRLRWPLGIAVLVSVLAGVQELPGVLETGRVLSLLPFFVLGLKLRPAHFELLRRPAVRVAGALVFACGLAVAWFAAPRMGLEWVYWRRSNDFLGVDDLTGTAMRVGMLICATVLSAAFLALVPRGRMWISGLGMATLYVYLLHGLPVKMADYAGLYDHPALHSVLGVAAAGSAGVVLALVLSTPVVRRLTGWAVEPKMTWAFRSRQR
jgi:fucose 4-O-acetylase-like acetyltransferase